MKQLRDFLFFLRKSPSGLAGITIIIVAILCAILAPYITPYDPEEPITIDNRMPPSGKHWFGTDETGMDIFTRVIYATRIDLTIGVLATLFSLSIGIPLGLLIGYYEGLFGEIAMRLTDLIQAFPVFIFAIALVAVLGNKIENVLLAITFLNSPIYLRLVRSEVLSMKRRQFVEAAQCGGMNSFQIMFRELLSNSVRPALIQASVNVGWAILLTAGLSFIGAGVRVPTPEWGSMISIGANSIITGQWWASFFPGIAIMVTVLGFALFGDFLRVYLDPERR
jgi:peptide/nickel transport system permease protein